jgi:hypothetical protein
LAPGIRAELAVAVLEQHGLVITEALATLDRRSAWQVALRNA